MHFDHWAVHMLYPTVQCRAVHCIATRLTSMISLVHPSPGLPCHTCPHSCPRGWRQPPSPEPPPSCSICDVTFASTIKLSSHIGKMQCMQPLLHQHTGPRRPAECCQSLRRVLHSCNICGHMCVSICALCSHMFNVHEIMSPPPLRTEDRSQCRGRTWPAACPLPAGSPCHCWGWMQICSTEQHALSASSHHCSIIILVDIFQLNSELNLWMLNLICDWANSICVPQQTLTSVWASPAKHLNLAASKRHMISSGTWTHAHNS